MGGVHAGLDFRRTEDTAVDVDLVEAGIGHPGDGVGVVAGAVVTKIQAVEIRHVAIGGARYIRHRRAVDVDLKAIRAIVPGGGDVHPAAAVELRHIGADEKITVDTVLKQQCQASAATTSSALGQLEIFVTQRGIEQHPVTVALCAGIGPVGTKPERHRARRPHRGIQIHTAVDGIALVEHLTGTAHLAIDHGLRIPHAHAVIAAAAGVRHLAGRTRPAGLVHGIPGQALYGTGACLVHGHGHLCRAQRRSVDPRLIDQAIEFAPGEALVRTDLQRVGIGAQAFRACATGPLHAVDVDLLSAAGVIDDSDVIPVAGTQGRAAAGQGV